jgi:drug/metabolite transporter (DMT)-like permease
MRIAGLLLGTAGVALVAQPGAAATDPLLYWALAAALGACASYGITGAIIKRCAEGVPARGLAMGSQLAAALILAPLLPVFPPAGPITPLVLACMLALGVLASAVALMLYYRLIADVGATRALTVTYLIPLFGVLFGALLLGESPPATALAGGILILAGTALVTRR